MNVTDLETESLKSGETVFVTGPHGQMRPENGAVGLFHEGTRYLCRWEATLDEREPIPLRASADLDSVEISIDATCQSSGALHLGDVHLCRELLLEPGFLYERVRITNQTPQRLEVALTFSFDADFADLFEVRGNQRAHRGRYTSEVVGAHRVTFSYEGLDQVTRTLNLSFDVAPQRLTHKAAIFECSLEPREVREIKARLVCTSVEPPSPHAHEEAWPAFDVVRESAVHRRRAHIPRLVVQSSDGALDSALAAAQTDLALLITERPTGPYPLAGIPWFATPFGRDGIITALQNLWWHPRLSEGVLRFLASRQASEDDAARDAEPGKILHEERLGEMAALGEVPYGRYYGSVDSTPLFVVLGGRYWEATGDDALIRSLWPNFNAAMEWIATHGDADGDGFVEYGRRSRDGLIQQGWKDSHDSVFYESGDMVREPVALCEVQAYVFEAYRAMEAMSVKFDTAAASARWRKKADDLQASFDTHFWDDEIGTFSLALDGEKKPCRVRTSNAGHCLFCGIATPKRAACVAETLLSQEMSSGWGIRTLATTEQRYNPISYHNGSVWPHDNSLIAAGFARYGLYEQADEVLRSTLALASQKRGYRLPELVCGFSSRRRGGPVPYPTACAPQAWAAGSLWLMLQASLGIEVRHGEIITKNARLPQDFTHISLNGLTTSRGRFSLSVERSNRQDPARIEVHVAPD